MKKGQTCIITNVRGSKIKYCTICKIVLTDENWHKYSRLIREYTCTKCRRKYDSNYVSTHYLDTYRNGKRIFLKGLKRLYPNNKRCELCKLLPKKFLNYHHWDDNDIRKGIWICWYCHGMIELLDRRGKKNIIKFIEKYLEFKRITNETQKSG